MKSVVQAGWLMTVAIGNLIVVIVAESRIIKEQVFDEFLYLCVCRFNIDKLLQVFKKF